MVFITDFSPGHVKCLRTGQHGQGGLSVWNQLIGEEKYKQWPEGVHRSAYLSKDVNAFIEVFTDCEFSNYYNMENIMKGKVKAFPGMTLRGRILTALDAAIGQHLA